MLTCGKCGATSPLGRVFCGSCGAKLEVRDLSLESLEERDTRSWIARHGKKVAAAVVILILLYVAQVFWPATAPIGEEGSSSSVQRVSAALNAFRTLGKGRKLGSSFAEAEINAYIKQTKLKKLDLELFSVDVTPGTVHARIVRKWKPVSLGGVSPDLKVSYDIWLKPFGRVLRVTKVRRGHLTLPGPLRYGVARDLLAQLQKQEDWKAFAYVTDIKADDGRIMVEVQRDL